MLEAPDPSDCKSFPIKTGLLYSKVPFKTGYTPPIIMCFERFSRPLQSNNYVFLCMYLASSILFLFQLTMHNKRSVNKVMRLIQYNSVLTLKLQIEFVPFKIVPLGGYTPPETLFPLFVATLVDTNRNRF